MIEIKREIVAAIERSKRTNRDIAAEMHIAPSAITNWTNSDRPVSIENLVALAQELKDERFEAIVIEKLFGIRIYNRIEKAIASPQAKYFAVEKEEYERKELDQKFRYLMALKPECRTDRDIEFVKRYIKEYGEEWVQEREFLNSVADDWGVNINEQVRAFAN